MKKRDLNEKFKIDIPAVSASPSNPPNPHLKPVNRSFKARKYFPIFQAFNSLKAT
jgi:hypothetical protein